MVSVLTCISSRSGNSTFSRPAICSQTLVRDSRPLGSRSDRNIPSRSDPSRPVRGRAAARVRGDQGPEMGKWNQVTVDADIDIFFCDPHSPWQRATNENTNGLLRQSFPKSSDLSAHSADDLDWVAAELNDRPRKRLGFKKPIEQIGPLLLR
jgi:IS30 family transposase